MWSLQRDVRHAVWQYLLALNGGVQKGVHKQAKEQKLLIAFETWGHDACAGPFHSGEHLSAN